MDVQRADGHASMGSIYLRVTALRLGRLNLECLFPASTSPVLGIFACAHRLRGVPTGRWARVGRVRKPLYENHTHTSEHRPFFLFVNLAFNYGRYDFSNCIAFHTPHSALDLKLSLVFPYTTSFRPMSGDPYVFCMNSVCGMYILPLRTYHRNCFAILLHPYFGRAAVR